MSIDIGIDEFSSEGAAAVTMASGVRVADVLARSIPVHWDEAVALLQELLDTVMSADRDDIPGFDDVVINGDGGVTVHHKHRGERGPAAAGRALHALLATADVPVALRLFVTQATVPDTHASLDAFAKALAYFGKSGRSELVRSIYARYRSAAGEAPAQGKSVVPPPVPAEARPTFEPIAQRPKRGVPKWAFAAVAAMAVIAALATAWRSFGGAIGQPPASTVQSAAGAAAELPKTRKATAESTKADRSLPSLRSNAATTENSPAPRNIAAPKVPIIASRDTLDPSRVPAIVAYETLRAPLMPSSFEAMAPAVPSADRASKTELANAIYSRDDSEVQPPVMLYPQMPPPLIVGGPPEGIVNSMELVIAPDGSVERVRLISAPRRMADMMLLSGAKLWRFSPAVKDGKPVRYRTTLSWTVFP